MICPYCKKEMRKGYVDKQSISIPLEWYPASPKSKGVLARSRESIKLTRSFGDSVIVHRCEDCKKLIIDEKELET